MNFLISLKTIFKENVRLLVTLLLLVVLLIVGYIFRGNIFPENSFFNSENSNQALISKVGKLVVLPTGETPTIAKVSNPEILKDKLFFADAKAGDVVLIYTNAKRAILYSPSLNRIINMSNVNVGDEKVPAPASSINNLDNTEKKPNKARSSQIEF